MKAVGYTASTAVRGPDVIEDLDIDVPLLRPDDLLIKVMAVSINPRDVKVRKKVPASQQLPQVLGWDAAGVVEEVGENVVNWNIGDEVFYAGCALRPGCLSEFHVVDSKIVGPKPRNLTFVETSALPLTGLTAYEMIFDRLNVPADAPGRCVMVLGGAGGVATMAIQLLKKTTSCVVIASASRPETRKWVTDFGADFVVNHREPLKPQLDDLGLGFVDYVISTNTTPDLWAEFSEIIGPQGKIGLLDDPLPLDLTLMKTKSISVHWESMFTRSSYSTFDMSRQGEILAKLSEMVEANVIRSAAGQHFGVINAENVRKAHELLETGRSMGKLTVAGF